MKPKYTDNRYQNGYTRSESTDIRKTFERIRRQQRENVKEAAVKVKPMIRVKAA